MDKCINGGCKKEFRSLVKTDKNNYGMSLETAIKAGYIDTARKPLEGINEALYSSLNKSSVEIRNDFIEKVYIPKVNLLKLGKIEIDYFDNWHEDLARKIKNYYENKGYEYFYVGKAQKWINMTLKYLWLYTDEKEIISKYIDKFHVPIDRTMANHIAKLIGYLPGYEDKKFVGLDDNFDAEKRNYCWSKITDYQEYLKCQKSIREKLKDIRPIEWEYCNWNKSHKLKSCVKVKEM